MTQMAGEKILGLLALAEQQNTDLQGKGGVVVDPFSDEPLIGMDLGGKTWEEQWMQKGENTICQKTLTRWMMQLRNIFWVLYLKEQMLLIVG